MQNKTNLEVKIFHKKENMSYSMFPRSGYKNMPAPGQPLISVNKDGKKTTYSSSSVEGGLLLVIGSLFNAFVTKSK
jgi:hypothetical protein